MSMAKQDVALQPRHTHTHNISSNDALLKAAAVGAGGVGASDGGGGDGGGGGLQIPNANTSVFISMHRVDDGGGGSGVGGDGGAFHGNFGNTGGSFHASNQSEVTSVGNSFIDTLVNIYV